jgi:hypothetical protein
LRLDDRRGVGLHTDAERAADVQDLLVRHAELLGQLVDPDVLGQRKFLVS